MFVSLKTDVAFSGNRNEIITIYIFIIKGINRVVKYEKKNQIEVSIMHIIQSQLN